jgi:hypothetical protein
MLNRGLQGFVHDFYGSDRWEEACLAADLPFFSFESMLHYDDDLTSRLLETLSIVLDRSKSEILEDFGTYVVSHEDLVPIRRLLRFGGETFVDFLHSLDDVHARMKVAMPNLEVPKLSLEVRGDDRFVVHYEFTKPGYGAVILGILRGMADDYGTLVTIEQISKSKGPLDREKMDIRLVDVRWRRTAEIRKMVS